MKILVTGPMVGQLPGQVTTQGEILSEWLRRDGHKVSAVSSHPNRYRRLLDCLVATWRQGGDSPVHCNQVYSGPSFLVTDLVTRAARRRGQRLVLHLHGGSLPDLFAAKPAWSRRVLSRADAIVAPSRYLAEAVRGLGFQATIIPNIVDFSSYPYRHRKQVKPNLFWMRSYHEIWNPLMAIDVMMQLVRQHPNARLIMGGQDKGLKSVVEARVDSEGLSQNVEVRGFMSPEQKFAAGDASDIFLNTNRIDNMPVAVVEACGMGLPVVSTNVGGIPFLLESGQTGLLVPPDDSSAMADALVSLLRNPALAARLSLKGRALALKSSPAEVLPHWERLFGHSKKHLG